jgi:hypothetical protein
MNIAIDKPLALSLLLLCVSEVILTEVVELAAGVKQEVAVEVDTKVVLLGKKFCIQAAAGAQSLQQVLLAS